MEKSIKKTFNRYTHTTKSNKSIEIFDNVYGYQKQIQLIKWILRQNFTFNIANDAVLTDQKSNINLSSKVDWTRDDYIQRFELETIEPVYEKIKNKNLTRCWINASTSNHVPRYHPDNFTDNSITILYYVNLKWDIDWDGQTIFRSDDMKEIEYVNDFVPGRLCMFDSSIPHKGTIPNSQAPVFRFTMNSTWE